MPLIFVFFLFFFTAYSQTSLDYPMASLNTTWINNARFTPNMINTISGVKIRILLLKGGGGPTFAAGFLCFPPCLGFVFSIFVINTSVNAETVDVMHDPPSLWCANRGRLVGENATLHFAKDGDLILRDNDGSFVWSTNTSESSVSAMALTSSGNLMLLNGQNESVWESFDYPTDTLLNGQMLRLGQSLSSNSSLDNTTRGKPFLSLQNEGLLAFVDSSTPLFYADILSKPRVKIHPHNITFINGRFEWVDGSSTLITDPENWAVQFVRLEFDGHLRVYGIGNNFVPGLTLLSDYTNFLLKYCDYPFACGEYAICFNEKCSCPVNAIDGDSSFFTPIGWGGQVKPGCTPVTPISCQSTKSHGLLPMGNISYFNYADKNGAALRGIDEESCKQACLMDCSCKAALFKYLSNVSEGDCYLPTELFTLKKNSSSFSIHYNSSAYIKVQMPSEKLPQNESNSSPALKSDRIRVTVPLFIIGSMLVASILILVIFKRCRKRKQIDYEDSDQFDKVRGVLARFSYEELHLATDGFKRMLGQGGFGSVFHGTLNSTKIAVKKLDGLGQGKKEFLAEVETIGSLHHINLVELIGFCAEKSHRLLVYEYMPNGSLDQWIFQSCKETVLDWKTRKRIILDIAKGLCYLHEECRQRIAHLDVKPQNILLDGKFSAKLADFGLSKLIDREQSEVMTKMRGTPGYLAPEWLTSIITEKADVYSFGVVVLEMMSGRRNLDPSQPEEAVHLIALLETMEGNPPLPGVFQYDEEEDAIELMGLAMWCLQSDCKRRPAMSMVVKVLEGSAQVESDINYDFFNSYQTLQQSRRQSSSSLALLH